MQWKRLEKHLRLAQRAREKYAETGSPRYANLITHHEDKACDVLQAGLEKFANRSMSYPALKEREYRRAGKLDPRARQPGIGSGRRDWRPEDRPWYKPDE
jgi:hypothetical protein